MDTHPVAFNYMVGHVDTLTELELNAMAKNLNGTCVTAALGKYAANNKLPSACLAVLHQSAKDFEVSLPAIYDNCSWQKHHVEDMWGPKAPTHLPKRMKNLQTLLAANPDFRPDATTFILRALKEVSENTNMEPYHTLDLVRYVAKDALAPHLPKLVKMLAMPGASVTIVPQLGRFEPMDLFCYMADICGVTAAADKALGEMQRRLLELCLATYVVPRELAREISKYY
jgi:hypothetical protein